ncbi:glycosyltransferase family 4 protein [Candidatus Sumerlaeota bacterium]|nr:glycosyltransferase family 4 protein [Candidatus Sumerlaeota bacterium]
MKVLVYLPIDAIVRTWATLLAADGHEVETTYTFSVFAKRVRWADWALANVTKNDAPRYLWKLLVSMLWARLLGKRVALFISIDAFDLCDRPVLRAILWVVNLITFHCATRVFLLSTRSYVARRYRLPERRIVLVRNCPDRVKYNRTCPTRPTGPTGPTGQASAPLTFLYHGELLWWHGLERFIPIYEELKKRRPVRLIVTGNFYPTAFRILGLTASRREVAVKRELAALLRRSDIEYRGHVPIEHLRRHMAEADFHVSLANDRDQIARTELRTCLLEAMAAGMACLHVPTPSLDPDIFRDGENIVLIRPDDPVASAEKILALANCHDSLDKIRFNAARTIAEHFDMRKEYARALAHLVIS